MSSPPTEIERRYCTIPSTPSTVRWRPRPSQPHCGDRADGNLRPLTAFHHLRRTNPALLNDLSPTFRQHSRPFRGRNDLNHRQEALPFRILALAHTVKTEQDPPFLRLLSLACVVYPYGAIQVPPYRRCNMPHLANWLHFLHIHNAPSPTRP